MIDLALLNNLPQARVLVVGDVMLDKYFQGDSHRISPEAPVPVVKVNAVVHKAGGAANVARNIAHLDGQVGLLGLIGADLEGAALQQTLVNDKITTHLLEQTEQPTITKIRVLAQQQQIVRLDIEESFSFEQSQQLHRVFQPLLNDYNCIVFSDYNKGSLQAIQAMIQTAKAADKFVLVDPKQADLAVYRHADLITPNLAEFRAAGGETQSEEALVTSARALLKQNGIGAMLLTRSEQGMSLITPNQHHHFPAQVLEVSDVTGAGDTVIATLATLLSAGSELPQAVEIANLAAGIVVAKRGTGTVTVNELRLKIHHYHASQFGKNETTRQLQPIVNDTERTLRHIRFAKENGERIVFTNGCFDILHAGHVRYLAQAKALGHRLVVGLNSDASVARLKGANRPINPLEDRATVLASLASVDWVIPFGDKASENDTPLELILAVQPHVLVKGGDYNLDTIVGANEVLAAGGEVKTLEFVEERSTSAIIARAQHAQ